MLVSFSTLAGGVFIEVGDGAEFSANARCFRFDRNGRCEYAFHGDLISSNPAPRWYGHQFTEKDFIFA